MKIVHKKVKCKGCKQEFSSENKNVLEKSGYCSEFCFLVDKNPIVYNKNLKENE